jgi:hypothetical protein
MIPVPFRDWASPRRHAVDFSRVAQRDDVYLFRVLRTLAVLSRERTEQKLKRIRANLQRPCNGWRTDREPKKRKP